MDLRGLQDKRRGGSRRHCSLCPPLLSGCTAQPLTAVKRVRRGMGVFRGKEVVSAFLPTWAACETQQHLEGSEPDSHTSLLCGLGGCHHQVPQFPFPAMGICPAEMLREAHSGWPGGAGEGHTSFFPFRVGD